ncbi:methionyl-tRNA formyltransferase, mitochondrial [Macrosteles quadrilineatus]|uniref:methionyl-tRNA formyltransferase, mitochondrial n=1 Tax=Macrosteles quadrilineatus TaxID=74068 RepID=UPI0023E2CF37|nr:methionyl-tRNA formyltransferase, mitochondrial [Macrosteles quadrilineatus]
MQNRPMLYFKTFCYATFFNQYASIFKCSRAEVQKQCHLNKLNYTTSAGPPWRIIFFGTDDFAVKSVQPLCAKLRTGTLMSDLTVVARPGSVVRKFAESEKLPIIEWPFKSDVIKNKFDLGVVVSFGHLIPEDIIKAIPLGILNVHGSLLPRWRGAAPILYAVMNADPETGVTIMNIEPKKFDTGSIVRQYRCAVGPDETTPQLTERLSVQGAKLLMECVRDLPRCLEMAAPQPKEGITYAPRVTMKLSVVDWTKLTAKQVYDLHRAITHLYALTTNWHGVQVRLLDIKLDSKKRAVENSSLESSSKSAIDFLNSNEQFTTPQYSIDSSNSPPGTIYYNKLNKTMKIQCADGLCVSCGSLRLGGKNSISPLDFYNGYMTKVDKSKWYFS